MSEVMYFLGRVLSTYRIIVVRKAVRNETEICARNAHSLEESDRPLCLVRVLRKATATLSIDNNIPALQKGPNPHN
jgi:hypothetical protein